MALRKAATSVILWGGSSSILSLTLPTYLATSGIIHFPTTVSTAFLATSIFILFPIGILRGILNATEHATIPAAGNAVVSQFKQHNITSDNLQLLNQSTQSLKEGVQEFNLSSTLISNSGGGFVARGLLGLFLPSTEVVLEHISIETSKTPGQEFLNLAKGATNGLIAGQITVIRDRLTMAGVFVAGTAVAVTIAADQTTAAAIEKKEQVVNQVKEKKDGVVDQISKIWKTQTKER